MSRLIAAIACTTAFAVFGCAAPTPRPDPYMAANAPEDRPHRWDNLSEASAALTPYVAAARATYPDAKARYLAGLPSNHSFFVTVELRDDRGRSERVFLAVDEIHKGTVRGRIWNDILVVDGFTFRQPHSVPESEILDWTITRPDGTEEGNYIGKYVDSLLDAHSSDSQ
jgi:hypothetical protein